jgi:hypothetical protein
MLPTVLFTYMHELPYIIHDYMEHIWYVHSITSETESLTQLNLLKYGYVVP